MRFQCENCDKIVSIDDASCGQAVGCGHCNSVTMVPKTRVSPKALINDFVISRTLGSGGMGTVYLAHQLSLDRPVALKILLDQFAHNSEFIVDFVREARAAARLNHPNIVQSYAVGEDEGIYFFAMEYVEGDTLKTVLNRDGKLDWKEAFNIIQQIAEALDFAWKNQQLVHRDIKPDNIMLTKRNMAKLADLGLARAAHETSEDDDDEVMGTPQYICPEQLLGQPMDVRGDIYSLGATLFHAITGNFPFEGNSAADIARKHLSAPVPDPREFDASIPSGAVYVVKRMMAKRLEDRYDDAEELVFDMGLVLRGQKPAGMKATGDEKESKKRKTKPGKTGRVAPTKRPTSTGRHAAASGRHSGVRPPASTTGRNKKAKVPAAPPPPPPTEGNRTMSSGKIKSTKIKSTRVASSSTSSVQSSPTGSTSGYQRPGTPKTAPAKSGGGGKVVAVLLVLVILGILSGVAWFIAQMTKYNFKTSMDAKTHYLFEVASQGQRDAYQELEAYFDGKYDADKSLEILDKANQFIAKYPNSLFARRQVKNPREWAILYNVPLKLELISENIPKKASVWVNQIPTIREQVFIPNAILFERSIRKKEEDETIELNVAKYNFDREKEKVWAELEVYAGDFVQEYKEHASRLTATMTTNESHFTEEKDTILKTLLEKTTMCEFDAAKLYLDRVAMPATQKTEYPNTIKIEAAAISREDPLEEAGKKLGEFHRRFIQHQKGGTVKKEELEEAFRGFIQAKDHETVIGQIRALPERERQLFDNRKEWIDQHIAAFNCALAYYKLVSDTGTKFGEGWDKKNVNGVKRAQNISNIGSRLRSNGWTSDKFKEGDQVWITNVTKQDFVVQLRRYTSTGSVTRVGSETIPHWYAANLTIFHFFAAQVKDTCLEDFNDARGCFEFYVRPTVFKMLTEKGLSGTNVTFLQGQADKSVELWNPAWAPIYIKNMVTGLKKMRSAQRRRLVKHISSIMSPVPLYQEKKEVFDRAAQ